MATSNNSNEEKMKLKIVKLKKLLKDKDRAIEHLTNQNKTLKEKLDESEKVVKKYKNKDRKTKKVQKNKI